MKKYLINNMIAPMLNRMRQGLLCLLLVIPIGLTAQAFDYGNGWYDGAQNYLRLKVIYSKLYRLYASQALTAGFDTTGIDPANIHLLYRGIEEYIHVEPAQVGGWEYVEFYGRRNDGGLDTMMYVDAYTGQYRGRLHPNRYRSTFSDTSVYYLMADNAPGLRMEQRAMPSTAQTELRNQIFVTTSQDYGPGSVYPFRSQSTLPDDHYTSLNPNWTWGEGYMGKQFDPNNPLVWMASTPQHDNTRPSLVPKYWTGVTSIEQQASTIKTSLPAANSASQVSFPSYGHLLYTSSNWIEGDFLADSSELHMEAISAFPTAGNFFASLIGISYPMLTNSPLAMKLHLLWEKFDVNDALYTFPYLSGTTAVAYDLMTHVRTTDSIHNGLLHIWVPGDTISDPPFQHIPHMVHLWTDSDTLAPIIVPNAPAHNLSATTNAADMVLITSRALSNSALAYQAYRQASITHPLNVKIVYVDEIYDEFGYGSPHPYAIKRFIKYALDQWALPPAYIMLWGRGNADIRAAGTSHVPAWGKPMSDNLYVSAFGRDTLYYKPEAAIGRVPLITDQQGMDYIAKIATFEGNPDASWMRNGIFVHGAVDTLSYGVIGLSQDRAALSFRAPSTLGRALKYGWLNGTEIMPNGISQNATINQGVGFINAISGNADGIGLSQPSAFTNTGKFPVLVLQSCFWGDFGTDTLSISEKWVLEPDKGAIASIGFSSQAFTNPAMTWSEMFCQAAFDRHTLLSLGELATHILDSMTTANPAIATQNHALCMNFLGDPSIHYRRGTLQVWPGDTDEDLLANNQDLLNIGIAYGDTGAVRPNASLTWVGQTATTWDSSFVSGINHVHADCDGNGTVNADDTLAILQNYGLAHYKAIGLLGGSADDPELAIEAVEDSLQDSSHLNLIVRLGSLEQPANSAYGIAWSVFYDRELVDSASVHVDFDSCWLRNDGANLLTLQRHLHALGRIDLAITRTDHTPISGYGTIARIGIVVIDNISGKLPGDTTLSPTDFIPGDARLVNAQGNEIPLQGIAKHLWVIGTVDEPALPADQLAQVYPNPVRDELYIQTRSENPCTISLSDLSGRLLLRQDFAAGLSKRIQMNALAAGAYLLKVENADGTFQAKVMKVD